MELGKLTKRVIQNYPVISTVFFMLIANNALNYGTTKYVRLNYAFQPENEAQQVLKEYDNFGIAKPFAWGSYKAAREILSK